jgi:hypothetical protein
MGRIAFRVAAVSALALVAGMGTELRRASAEFFDYTTTISVTPISGITNATGGGTPLVTLTTSGSDSITLQGNASSGPLHINAGTPGTDITFANIAVSVTDTSTAQDVSFDFVYTLNLTNFAEEAVGGPQQGTAQVLVSGTLSGSLGAGRKANINDLKNYATTPSNGLVTMGGIPYTVTLNAYTPPGPDNPGAFGAHVVAAVPEPDAFVSLALGLVGVVGYVSRGRLRRRMTPAA